jgi:hypothetical protein
VNLLKKREAECRGVPADADGVIAAFDLHADEGLGIDDRQTAETHGVDQLKYRGVDPDTERERQYCGKRKTWALAQ